eukprot:6303877-Prymnesium_polylepis.1
MRRLRRLARRLAAAAALVLAERAVVRQPLVLLLEPFPAVSNRVVGPAWQQRRDQPPTHAHLRDALPDRVVLLHGPRTAVDRRRAHGAARRAGRLCLRVD